METINSNIYFTSNPYIAPIDVVEGSQVGLRFTFTDYTIPSNAKVIAYARGKYAGETYKADCSVSDGAIILVPPDGFFVPGQNILQFEINGAIIAFAVTVICQERTSEKGDASTPETVKSIAIQAAEILETAAQNASSAAQSANSAAQLANSAAENANNAENAIAQAEALRVTAENGRVTAEQSRVTAETGRVDAENARNTAETNRASAETQRQTASAKAVQDAEKATADCIAATKSATDAASALLNQASTIALQLNETDGGLDVLIFKEDT